jgi:hypothetical protein
MNDGSASDLAPRSKEVEGAGEVSGRRCRSVKDSERL